MEALELLFGSLEDWWSEVAGGSCAVSLLVWECPICCISDPLGH
jgi:hypothetical protein